MILTHEEKTLETNIEDQTPFRIAATREAFEALSGSLYEDRHLAILRELGTNALDAHIDAGIPSKPIEVDLPTEWSNKISIRDCGTGMSHETIVGLYSTYFDSSRRTTNETAGAYGLGSKSPFSLVSSFVVKTKTTSEERGRIYLVAVGKSGVPEVSYLGPWEHTEPSGTHIELAPAKEAVPRFRGAVPRAFLFFDPQPLGNVRELLPKENPWLTASSRLSDGTRYLELDNSRSNFRFIGYSESCIVQGPVGYPIRTSSITEKYDTPDLIYSVPIGSVRPSAGRESLSLDESTTAYLREKHEYLTTIVENNRRLRTLMEKAPLYHMPKKYREDYVKKHYPLWSQEFLARNRTINRRGCEIDFSFSYTHDGIRISRKSRGSTFIRPTDNHFFVEEELETKFTRTIKEYIRQKKISCSGDCPIYVHVYPKTRRRFIGRLTEVFSLIAGKAPIVYREEDWPRLKPLPKENAERAQRAEPTHYTISFLKKDPTTGMTSREMHKRVGRTEAYKFLQENEDCLLVRHYRTYPDKGSLNSHIDVDFDRREENTKLYQKIHDLSRVRLMTRIDTAFQESVQKYGRATLIRRAALIQSPPRIREFLKSFSDSGLPPSKAPLWLCEFQRTLELDITDRDIPLDAQKSALILKERIGNHLVKKFPLLSYIIGSVPSEEFVAYIVGREKIQAAVRKS